MRPRHKVMPRLLGALALSAGLMLPAGALANGDIELTGTLSGLPAEGLTLPPASTVTAEIQVPIAGGSSQISFTIAFKPNTEVKLANPLVQNGQLVEVELAIQSAGLVVSEIKEAELGAFSGTLTNIPGGTLTLPVAADTTVTLLVGGLPGGAD